MPSSRPAPFQSGQMPFLEHLEELRWRLLWSALAIGLGTVGGFILVLHFGVLDLLVEPVRPYLDGGQPIFLNPATSFFVTLKLSLVVGILLGLPVVVYQVWAFFSPALEASERRVIVPSLYFGLVLFCAGVSLAYFWVLPLALRFLMGFQSDVLMAAIEIQEYLGFVTRMLLAFGLVFELPVVIMILSALGLVTPEFLASKRRHAIVGVTILSSLLTPGDLASTLLMMGPMIILYEVSILLSRFIYRRKRREEAEKAARRQPSPDPPAGAVDTGDKA